MKIYSLKSSIVVIYSLLLAVLVGHFVIFFYYKLIWLKLLCYIYSFFVTILYLLQLRFNLEKYFLFQGVRLPVIFIMIATGLVYSFVSLIGFVKPSVPDHSDLMHAMILILTGFMGAAGILLNAIFYFILGRKLWKQFPAGPGRIAGINYSLLPLYTILAYVLIAAGYERWTHLQAIAELLSPCCMLKIYYDLIKKEKREAIPDTIIS
jgi:hypothetical protein